MEVTAEMILLSFYVDAKTKDSWDEAVFRHYSKGLSIREYINFSKEKEIFALLNKLVTSNISNPRA